MKSIELFAPNALKPFVSCCAKRNIPAEKYLERNHIPPALVHSGKGKILKKQAYRFFSDIAQKEGLKAFGLLEGDTFDLNDLGLINKALQQAVALKDAIGTFISLIPSVAEGNEVWLKWGKDISWLYCRTRNLMRTDFVPDQTTILTLRALIRLTAGPDWQPPKVHFFSQEVPVFDNLPEWSGSEVHFSQHATGIAFPTHLLSTRLIHTNNAMQGELIQEVLPTTLSNKLQVYLHSLYAFRHPTSIDQVAEMLGTSRVTLYRSLAKEGTSYRKIIDRVRYQIAVDLLEKSSLSITDIAHELSYSNVGNFSRAFYRISGTNPTSYRDKYKSVFSGEEK